MTITLSALQKQRYDTAANWTAENPTLLAGEIGVESDTGKIKIGTGATAWTSLSYSGLIPGSGVYPYSQLLMPSGTAGAPSISFDGDGDTGIYRTGANAVAISTNGAQRINIEADGDINIDSGGVFYDATNNRLAIGTTSPSEKLEVAGDAVFGSSGVASKVYLRRPTDGTYNSYIGFTSAVSSTDFAIKNGSGSGNVILEGNSGNIIFNTAATTERARIDNSGRLLVGTSSSGCNDKLTVQFGGTSGSTGVLGIRNGNATSGLSSGGILGVLNFGARAAEGDTYASISGVVDGTPGSGDYPGRLVFSTCASGSSSPTERMRIHANGGISTNALTSGPNTTTFGLFIGRLGNTGLLEASRDVNGTTAAQVFGGNSGVAYVMGDGDLENTNNRYTGMSDARLKQNIEDASSQWQDIKSIQVRKYELIANPERKHIGCVAQELEQICPGLVIEREDLEGQSYKSVAYSVLYMKAVKALQEAMERIEVLEAKVNALEGN